MLGIWDFKDSVNGYEKRKATNREPAKGGQAVNREPANLSYLIHMI